MLVNRRGFLKGFSKIAAITGLCLLVSKPAGLDPVNNRGRRKALNDKDGRKPNK